jgi:hypothetical protein
MSTYRKRMSEPEEWGNNNPNQKSNEKNNNKKPNNVTSNQSGLRVRRSSPRHVIEGQIRSIQNDILDGCSSSKFNYLKMKSSVINNFINQVFDPSKNMSKQTMKYIKLKPNTQRKKDMKTLIILCKEENGYKFYTKMFFDLKKKSVPEFKKKYTKEYIFKMYEENRKKSMETLEKHYKLMKHEYGKVLTELFLKKRMIAENEHANKTNDLARIKKLEMKQAIYNHEIKNIEKYFKKIKEKTPNSVVIMKNKLSILINMIQSL